jgi:HEAT repeat protein
LEELNDEGAPVWAGELRGEWGIPSNVGLYLEELRSADANIRGLAAEKLGRVKDSAAVVPLMDALSDPQPAVRAMATWALDEINPTRHPTPVSQGRN